MEGLFNRRISRVLLQINDLLKVDLVATLACSLTRTSISLTDFRIPFLVLQVVSERHQRKGLRSDLLFCGWSIGDCSINFRVFWFGFYMCWSLWFRLYFFFPVLGKSARFRGKSHVVRVDLFLLVAGSKLDWIQRTIGGLGSNWTISNIWVSKFILKDTTIPFLFDTFGGRKDTGPIC